MKKILIFTFLPFLSLADGIDKKIDEAFAPISNFFSNVVFFTINDIDKNLIYFTFCTEN